MRSDDDNTAEFLIQHLPVSEVSRFIIAREEVRRMAAELPPLGCWIEPDPFPDDPDGRLTTIPVPHGRSLTTPPLRSGSRRRHVRRACRAVAARSDTTPIVAVPTVRAKRVLP